MQSGGKLAPHMHDSGWITGSIYINVPPKSETDSGNLVLCLSDQDHVLGVEQGQQSIIDVVTGSLCLFPSSLHHYTVPFEGKEGKQERTKRGEDLLNNYYNHRNHFWKNGHTHKNKFYRDTTKPWQFNR
jgi:hypothetical protein